MVKALLAAYLIGCCFMPGSLASTVNARTSPPTTPAAITPVEVTSSVNIRVELVAAVFQLADMPEFANQELSAYQKAVKQHFEPFRGHEAAKLARTYQKLRKPITETDVYNFAVNIRDEGSLNDMKPVIWYSVGGGQLHECWRQSGGEKFLAALNDFAKVSKADEFFAKHNAYFAEVNKAFRTQCSAHGQIASLAGFFGKAPSAKFAVVVSPLLNERAIRSGLLFGDESRDYLPVIGIGSAPSIGVKFKAESLDALASVYAHAHVDALALKAWPKIKPHAGQLAPLVYKGLAEEGFDTPERVVNESIVRACIARMVARMKDEKAGAERVEMEQLRSFIWTRELTDVLSRYEKTRDQYATLDAFTPEIVEVFEKAAMDIKAHSKRIPRVVSASVFNGAMIDSKTKEIVITFDQPMNPQKLGFTGEQLPDFADKPWFSTDGLTLTIPVKLVKEKQYVLALNDRTNRNFRSMAGYALETYRITFRTKP